MKNRFLINLNWGDERTLIKLSSGNTAERRAFDIFKYLLLRNDFKPFVERIRKKLNINSDVKQPISNGHLSRMFKSFYSRGGYSHSTGMVFGARFFLPKKEHDEVAEYIKKSKIFEKIEISSDWGGYLVEQVITEYILFGFIRVNDPSPLIISLIDDSVSGGIRIEAPADITQDEMITALKKSWLGIRQMKATHFDSNKKKRQKGDQKFFKHIKIYNKYQELISKSPNIKNPEIEVVSLLKKDNIFISEGLVRTVISRLDKEIEKSNSK